MIIEDVGSLESIKHAIYASCSFTFNFSGIWEKICPEKKSLRTISKLLLLPEWLSSRWISTNVLMTVEETNSRFDYLSLDRSANIFTVGNYEFLVNIKKGRFVFMEAIFVVIKSNQNLHAFAVASSSWGL